MMPVEQVGRQEWRSSGWWLCGLLGQREDSQQDAAPGERLPQLPCPPRVSIHQTLLWLSARVGLFGPKERGSDWRDLQ